VARLVASQFPQWADLPVSAVSLDGWDNSTFRLGDEMSVRLPSADIYAAQVEKEHRWLPVLALQLPLPIPRPLAKGAPGFGYPRPWSVYGWLQGEPAAVDRIGDLVGFAADLAEFVAALQRSDPSGGPAPGEHNFFRGGPLSTYEAETRRTIAALSGRIDASAAAEVWEAALDARFEGSPVWVHGDVTPANLLVDGGRLKAVIDFGSSGVGDPACDVAVAWTFFSGRSRETFRATLAVDDATWLRGGGWALWKALITLLGGLEGSDDAGSAGRRLGWRWSAQRVIEEVLAELDRET
jgi:aminoglycoside phosphotransferase (APT) family kinase protein